MKFPHYKQFDLMDCGPTCLRMIAKFYGRNYSMDYLRSLSFMSKLGSSLSGISEAAESIGFHTQGMKLTWNQLVEKAHLPCIVHWKNNHFVVVYGVKRKKNIGSLFTKNDEYVVKVSDPAFGLVEYTKKEFLNGWVSHNETDGANGIALLIEPTPVFYSEKGDESSRLRLGYLLRYLRPHASLIFQIFIGSLIGMAISLIFPFLTQSIVDFGISNNDLNFVLLVLFAQLVLTAAQAFNSLIRSWVSLHVTTRVGISLISGFLTKLMRLPISFFDIKVVGDIMQRIGDHNRIQNFLTGSLVNIIFAILTLLTYSAVMATYNVSILGIFYAGSALYILWLVLFLNRRRALDYKRFQHSSANQGNIVQLINGMQEIKLNNCERRKRWEWERIQAQLFKVSVKSLTLTQTQQVGSMFIDQAKNIAISFLAAKAVIDGNMTLGMMVAMQYIIGQLNAPVQQFIGFVQEAQDAKISLERLAEIHAKPDEETADDGRIKEIPAAGISIRNLTFQYEGSHSEKVLNNVSLEIPRNKITAIVGMSGSGKSTLIKLLLGFYKPTQGDILINGVPLDKYSPSAWRACCGTVMQEGYIFSDTIAGNIGISDESIDEMKLIAALETANIKEFVDSLPMGMNTKIGVEGHGLSSGQKQRILIARSVYKNPSFLLFDEATNALDSTNEQAIVNNLQDFFQDRTVVVVAHRLSTIKNADQIVVLRKGIVTESGTHHQLLANRGAYYDLVKDQLELTN